MSEENKDPEVEEETPVEPEESEGEDNEGETEPEVEPEVDPEEPEEPEVEPEEPEEEEVDLDKIVNSLTSNIVIPTRPHLGEKYIETNIIKQLRDVPDSEDIEFTVDDIPENEVEPTEIVIIFTLKEQISEKKFNVSTVLYEKLNYLDEMHYVAKDGKGTVGDVEEYFTNIFKINDVTQENVKVSYNEETGKLDVGYEGVTLKTLDVLKVDFDVEVDMHPIINEEYEDELVRLILDKGIELTDTEGLNDTLNQLLDDNGVLDVTILQHIHSREFIIIPITYRFEGEGTQYRFIITRLSVEGTLEYDDDSSDDGLYPPGAEGTPNSRFATSALSRHRTATAFNQEIAVEKNIGEFLIKDYNGNVISYDKISRQKTFERQVISDAKLSGLFGTIARLDFENMTLPGVIVEDSNILSSVVLNGEGTLKKVSLALDLDTILLGLDSKLASHSTNAEVTFTITQGGSSEDVKIDTSASDFISLDVTEYINIENNDHEVKLSSIKFKVDERYGSRNTRLILNDALVIIEELEK